MVDKWRGPPDDCIISRGSGGVSCVTMMATNCDGSNAKKNKIK